MGRAGGDFGSLRGTFLNTPYVLRLIAAWLTTPAQVYVTFMVIILNHKLLPPKIRPQGFSLAINVIWATILLAYFIVWTIKDRPF